MTGVIKTVCADKGMAELFAILKPYVNHHPDCTFGQNNPDGDYCTCGLRAAKDAANKLLEAAKK